TSSGASSRRSPASGTQPVAGDLRLEAPLEVAGAAVLSARDATLDATQAILAGEGWTLSWAHAEGERVEARWRSLDVGEGVREQEGWTREPLAFGPGTLERVACEAACFVLLIADGNGTLAMAGGAAGEVRRTTALREYCPQFCGGGPGSYARRVPPGLVHAGGAGTPLEDARATGEGRLVVFFAHAVADVATEEGRARLSARGTERLTVGPPGQPVWRQYTNGYVRLELHGATLATPAGTDAEMMAAAPRVAFDGAVSAASATGALTLGGERRELHHEPFAVEGAGVVDLGPAPEAPLAERGTPARIAGHARTVQAGAFLLEPAPVPAPATAAALALAALALLAALAWPLYSRIRPNRVLAHPNRARLLGLVQARPGSSVADLARATGLARVVVQHHLRILLRHGLLRRVRTGNAQAHYPAAEAPRADEAQAFALLADATRRRLAARLAREASPLTQSEVAARVGVSRRLANHHLLRLEEAGLVRREAGRPRRYAPTSRLAALLARLGVETE
ncbi:MAG TPA: helix-turn-helix domain-containing protein, partial [Candidatus Thermoplasmatota archaeon]|nr:helix-turn-helix domain-containing protein [Candidatus Thermoplasmatota archaeon]